MNRSLEGTQDQLLLESQMAQLISKGSTQSISLMHGHHSSVDTQGTKPKDIELKIKEDTLEHKYM